MSDKFFKNDQKNYENNKDGKDNADKIPSNNNESMKQNDNIDDYDQDIDDSPLEYLLSYIEDEEFIMDESKTTIKDVIDSMGEKRKEVATILEKHKIKKEDVDTILGHMKLFVDYNVYPAEYYNKIEAIFKSSNELSKTEKNIIQIIFNLPFKYMDFDNEATKERLEKELNSYVHHKEFNALKEYIIGSIITKNKEKEKLSFLFYGPPGTGKSYLARRIANALGVKLITISSQSLTELDIAGSNKTWNEAQPSLITNGLLSNNDYKNAVILIDEIDKAPERNFATILGQISSLIDTTLPFKDMFLDLPLDLNGCIFILTANNISALSKYDHVISRVIPIEIDLPDDPTFVYQNIVSEFLSKKIDLSKVNNIKLQFFVDDLIRLANSIRFSDYKQDDFRRMQQNLDLIWGRFYFNHMNELKDSKISDEDKLEIFGKFMFGLLKDNRRRSNLW